MALCCSPNIFLFLSNHFHFDSTSIVNSVTRQSVTKKRFSDTTVRGLSFRCTGVSQASGCIVASLCKSDTTSIPASNSGARVASFLFCGLLSYFELSENARSQFFHEPSSTRFTVSKPLLCSSLAAEKLQLGVFVTHKLAALC